jgi:hypothetical protein
VLDPGGVLVGVVAPAGVPGGVLEGAGDPPVAANDEMYSSRDEVMYFISSDFIWSKAEAISTVLSKYTFSIMDTRLR